MQSEPRAFGRFIAVMIFLVVITLISVASGNQEITVDLDNPETITLLQVTQVLASIVTFILPAILIVVFLSATRTRFLGIHTFPRPVFWVIAFFLIISSLPFIGALETLNRHFSLPPAFSGLEDWMKSSEEKAGKITTALLKMDTPGSLVVNLFVIGLMAAISEEIFFRGLLQNVLKEQVRNYHIAIWTSAIIFSAFHMQFFGFVPRMIIGAILGYLFEWSGSLWVPILAHFTNNAFGVISSYLVQHHLVAGDPDTSGTEKQNFLLVGISILVSAGLLYFAWRIKMSRAAENEIRPV